MPSSPRTNHQHAVYDHAASLLAGTDSPARALEEVSVLYRQAGHLHGTVIETASIATTLAQMVAHIWDLNYRGHLVMLDPWQRSPDAPSVTTSGPP